MCCDVTTGYSGCEIGLDTEQSSFQLTIDRSLYRCAFISAADLNLCHRDEICWSSFRILSLERGHSVTSVKTASIFINILLTCYVIRQWRLFWQFVNVFIKTSACKRIRWFPSQLAVISRHLIHWFIDPRRWSACALIKRIAASARKNNNIINTNTILVAANFLLAGAFIMG